MLVYRVMIVSVLTVADLGIAAFIANRYSCAKAVVFFLNPVSIIITGYHNQFDTIAVLFALLSILYINEEESFSKKDIFAILFLSLSLMTKHILFLLPVFILLTNNIPLKKRIVYAIVPPVVFLLSFAPFAIQNNAALQGIINNVFLYRSFNNAPLLDILYKQIGFPSGPRIYVYGIMMLVPAWLVRREKYEHILLIYLIAMVSFSSAIANQYLAIPMAALCVLYVKPWHNVYMIATRIYLLLDGNGLGLLNTIQYAIPGSEVERIAGLYLY